MAVVKSVEVAWAHVQSPSQFDKYSIDAYIPKELAKKLTDEGVGGMCKKDKKAQKNKVGDILWQFKTNAKDKEGKPTRKPPIVDSKRDPFTKLIGNGSICNIQYNVKDWTYGTKKGKSPFLERVQVLELVEYEGGSEDEFEVEEGYTSADSGDEFEDNTSAGADNIDDDDPFED